MHHDFVWSWLGLAWLVIVLEVSRRRPVQCLVRCLPCLHWPLALYCWLQVSRTRVRSSPATSIRKFSRRRMIASRRSVSRFHLLSTLCLGSFGMRFRRCSVLELHRVVIFPTYHQPFLTTLRSSSVLYVLFFVIILMCRVCPPLSPPCPKTLFGRYVKLKFNLSSPDDRVPSISVLDVAFGYRDDRAALFQV